MKKKYLPPTIKSFHTNTLLLQNYSVKGYQSGGTKSFGDTEENISEKTQNSLWNP